MARWVRFIVLAVLVGAVFYLLQFTPGPIPPLGPFLNPFGGFWTNGTSLDELPGRLELEGLQETVEVIWDDRRVPHVFARNAHDLYFAQGYVTARDRLWQMDFQIRASAGRLAEVLGAGALPYDRHRRRLGMLFAAENSVLKLKEDPEALVAVQAYVDGINTWIDGLTRRTLPLEFKILDYEPERWTLLHSALLNQYMAWTLSTVNREVAHTRAVELLGRETAERLYPVFTPFLEPAIPAATPWSFDPVAVPEPPPEHVVPAAALPGPETGDGVARGSNNWAVSGERTESGYPILANDPHLGLNLPSIWYEIQLASPEGNAYGASLPGAPTVITGFNDRIAWGVTNTETDVLDWYRIEFRDPSRAEYRHGDGWRPVQVRTEEIRVRGGGVVREDVLYTHHGPVVALEGEEPYDSSVPVGAAMRWTAHDPSAVAGAFLRLNRAGGYDDYVEALTHFECPAQNFAFASADGDIALWHNGKFPLRWEGQGRTLSDGTDPRHDWQGSIPHEHLPHVLNPERGFVSSANQRPTAPGYPYFLMGNYASHGRAARINEELGRLTGVTPQDFMDMQLDTLDYRARQVLPTLLEALDGVELGPEESEGRRLLAAWDHRYEPGSRAPVLFEAWWRDLVGTLWRDVLGEEDRGLRPPGTDITLQRLLSPEEWAGFGAGDPHEHVREAIRTAFRAAVARVVESHGLPGPAWQWSRTRGTQIRHLARIPAFGRLGLQTGGAAGVINATTRYGGPSWRMVVALGPEVRAWGIYPGGQSGNPGSPHYDQFIDDWVAGKMYEFLYLRSPDEASERIVARSVLEGGS